MSMSSIQVIVWDFDGTLYQKTDAHLQEIRALEINAVMRHTGWDTHTATQKFYDVYGKKTPSGTEAVSLLTGIPHDQVTRETSGSHYDSYIHIDKKLKTMFDALTSYRHYFLVNGTVKDVLRGLKLLGIPQDYFTEIVTPEIVGVSKPNTKGFRYILEKTGLPPDHHLMVGDREAVDLAPAASLGMKTCLVWSEKRGEIADITLPRVYDIVNSI